jgi:GT2 family glycosyltransferase
MRENLGYSGGADRIIRETDGHDYILLLNPDAVLDSRCLEEMVRVMESAPGAGSVGGKLLLGNPQLDDGAGSPTPRILDSTGHLIFRNRRIIDRGHGEVDEGQYDRLEEIFSVCGAAVLFRRAMLEEVRIGSQYFDEDFFAYKEDVDICWRAQLLGWDSLYHPAASAYHLRGWKRREIVEGLKPKAAGTASAHSAIDTLRSRNGLWDGCGIDGCVFGWGSPGDLPIVGGF